MVQPMAVKGGDLLFDFQLFFIQLVDCAWGMIVC